MRIAVVGLCLALVMMAGCSRAPEVSAPPSHGPDPSPGPGAGAIVRRPVPDLPVPVQPYTDAEPHPIDVADFRGEPGIEGVTLDSAWFITPDLQIATGHTSIGKPGMVVYTPGAESRWQGLSVDGAPGPARIQGVKGHWVVIAQGYGYQAYNIQTHETVHMRGVELPLEAADFVLGGIALGDSPEHVKAVLGEPDGTDFVGVLNSDVWLYRKLGLSVGVSRAPGEPGVVAVTALKEFTGATARHIHIGDTEAAVLKQYATNPTIADRDAIRFDILEGKVVSITLGRTFSPFGGNSVRNPAVP